MKHQTVGLLILSLFLGKNAWTSDRVTYDQMRLALPEAFHILGPEIFNYVFESLSKNQGRTADTVRICNGRLTLTSGTPVTTSSVTAATTVYFTPFLGNRITIYNGTSWDLLSFTEKSVSVPATTVTPFDIFGYSNSGTLALEAVNWTNDTTRATALSMQDGVYVKGTDTSRRYLGTARTTAVSGQTEDSSSKRFLWNSCNRLPRPLLAQTNTDSWSYSIATWRSINNNTTAGIGRLEYVVGQAVEPIPVENFMSNLINASYGFTSEGIGTNSTSANSADLYGGAQAYTSFLTLQRQFPSVGYSYLQWLEISVATGVTTFYTKYTQGGVLLRQAGYIAEFWG